MTPPLMHGALPAPTAPVGPGPMVDLRPMDRCVAAWRRAVHGDRVMLEHLLADDAVLHSPVTGHPLAGKPSVLTYLASTSRALADAASPSDAVAGDGWDGRFRYLREVVGAHDAVLEFETTVAGARVNGIDMLRCDDAGRIIDVTVMVRPLAAIGAVRHAVR